MQNQLQKLESYQRSGSSLSSNDGDSGDVCGGGKSKSQRGQWPPTAETNESLPVLKAQFSLIGDEEDDDYEREVTEVHGLGRSHDIKNMIAHFCSRRIMGSLLLLLIGVAIIGSKNPRVHDGFIRHSPEKASTTASHDSGTCPVQSSFFVSAEIMKLKNSSAVENQPNGAVATDNPICSKVGVSILRDQGGNAADAAVASALCLGVVNPSSSGIGGGAFILVHSNSHKLDREEDLEMPPFDDARTNKELDSRKNIRTTPPNRNNKITEFIDCRETAPQNSTYDMFESLPVEASTFGGLAIGVPGELRGLELLHRRFGYLPWKEVVRPAMLLARDGFLVQKYLAKAIREKENTIRDLPNLAHILTKNNDGETLLKEGEMMKNPQLAKTLNVIMEEGADAIYKGDLAKMLAKDIQDAGGIITFEDIENYRPVLRDPLIARNVAGFTIVGAPPPSSGGGVIIGALRFLSGYATPLSSLMDTLTKHWYVEACRHVFSIRMSLSDPKFDPDVNADAIQDLTEGNYMESLRKKTLDETVLSLSQYGGEKWSKLKDTEGNGTLVDAQEGDRLRRISDAPPVHDSHGLRKMRLFNYLDDHGTTSLTVVDKDRNTVTITSSVNLEFGSKIASPSTGVVLNNQMDDFSTPGRANYFGLHPSESNYAAPGKRALSSMSPTIVFRDNQNEGGDMNLSTGSDFGDLVLSIGGSGGPKIITSVIQTIINFLYFGMPLYESVTAPRIHNQLLYHGALGSSIEQDLLPQGPTMSLSNRTRDALTKRGHNLIPSEVLGTIQAVAVDLETGTLASVADVRKEGMPAGY